MVKKAENGDATDTDIVELYIEKVEDSDETFSTQFDLWKTRGTVERLWAQTSQLGAEVRLLEKRVSALEREMTAFMREMK